MLTHTEARYLKWDQWLFSSVCFVFMTLVLCVDGDATVKRIAVMFIILLQLCCSLIRDYVSTNRKILERENWKTELTFRKALDALEVQFDWREAHTLAKADIEKYHATEMENDKKADRTIWLLATLGQLFGMPIAAAIIAKLLID